MRPELRALPRANTAETTHRKLADQMIEVGAVVGRRLERVGFEIEHRHIGLRVGPSADCVPSKQLARRRFRDIRRRLTSRTRDSGSRLLYPASRTLARSGKPSGLVAHGSTWLMAEWPGTNTASDTTSDRTCLQTHDSPELIDI